MSKRDEGDDGSETSHHEGSEKGLRTISEMEESFVKVLGREVR